MAFYSLNTQQKQYVKISAYAEQILAGDREGFRPDLTPTGFLNLVLECFMDKANAAVTNTASRYREELRAALSEENPIFSEKNLSGSSVKRQKQVSDLRKRLSKMVPDAKETAIELLAGKREIELSEAALSGEREVSMTFRLNNENFAALYPDDGEEWPDRRFYAKTRTGQDSKSRSFVSRFVAAVFEEYAAKSEYEREAVIFTETINLVAESVKAGRILVVTIRHSGKKWEVRPYGIFSDSGRRYHYLVGFGRAYHSGDPEQLSSIRVTNIKEIRTGAHRSGRILKEEKAKAKQEIRLRGAEYLLEEAIDVVVRMTPRGKKRYDIIRYGRPRIQETAAGGIYRFRCTERQAENYFVRLGNGAEVLEPARLRKRMAEWYRKGAKVYGNEKGPGV